MSKEWPRPVPESLSIERIKLARETLRDAMWEFIHGAPGAIQQDDPDGVVCEAKRNLTALVITLHGRDAWQQILDED